MAKLRIAPPLLDRVINHVSGVIRGVAKVYNQFDYLDERTAALDAWGRHVERLVGANVVTLQQFSLGD
jgi:hypothetical protein